MDVVSSSEKESFPGVVHAPSLRSGTPTGVTEDESPSIARRTCRRRVGPPVAAAAKHGVIGAPAQRRGVARPPPEPGKTGSRYRSPLASLPRLRVRLVHKVLRQRSCKPWAATRPSSASTRVTDGPPSATVLRQGRVHSTPAGSVKDRIAMHMIEDGREAGRAQARRHHHRGHQRKHRRGPGHGRRPCKRLQDCIFVLPDKQSEEKRAALRAYGARASSSPRPTSSPRIPAPTTAWRARLVEGDPQRILRKPVPQPRQPRGPLLREHRAGALRAAGRQARRLHRGPGHRRHHHRHRQVPQGAEPGHPGRGRRPRSAASTTTTSTPGS